MDILYDCIKEHCNEIIKKKRAKIDFINENYSIMKAPYQRKLVFKLIDEINKLNKAMKQIEDGLVTIQDIEDNKPKNRSLNTNFSLF